jgi:peptidoglycan/LPS O-acetylase OafA/YrhL
MDSPRDQPTAAPEAGHVANAAAAAGTVQGALVTQASQVRFASVEAVRALAAIGVVVGHSWGAAGGSFYDTFGDRIISAVAFGAFFFFALSGALLYLPFARRDFGGGRRIDLRQYGINRALRIFPLYYANVIIVLLVLEGGGSTQEWLRWGLFLENFWPRELLEVNGVLWTIVIELHFYASLPLIAWFVARMGRGTIRGAALVLLGLALVSLAIRAKYWLLPDPAEQNEYVYFSILSTFFLIAAGMLAALVQVAWSNGRPAWVRGVLASSDAWFLAAIPLWLLVAWDYDYDALLAPASFLVLGGCLLPLEGRRIILRILEWKPIVILGLASYSIYVWHVPMLEVVTDDGTNALADSFLVLLSVAVPLACAVALLSYRVIEAPVLRLRRRWVAAITPRPQAAAPAPPRAGSRAGS